MGKLGAISFILLIIAIAVGGSLLILQHAGSGTSQLEIIPPRMPESYVEVYLSGAVSEEGIYTFDGRGEFADMLAAAGGMIEDLETIRLRIRVLSAEESPFSSPLEIPETEININTASSKSIQTLTGIGEVKAQAIIDHREEYGPFESIDSLVQVKGIGPKTLEKIRDKITVV